LNRRVPNGTHGGVRGREITQISLLLDRFPMLRKKLLNYSKGIDRSQRTKYYLKELHTAML